MDCGGLALHRVAAGFVARSWPGCCTGFGGDRSEVNESDDRSETMTETKRVTEAKRMTKHGRRWQNNRRPKRNDDRPTRPGGWCNLVVDHIVCSVVDPFLWLRASLNGGSRLVAQRCETISRYIKFAVSTNLQDPLAQPNAHAASRFGIYAVPGAALTCVPVARALRGQFRTFCVKTAQALYALRNARWDTASISLG